MQSALMCRITRYVIKHFYGPAVKVVVAPAHTHPPRLHLKAVSVNRSGSADREVTAETLSGFTLPLITYTYTSRINLIQSIRVAFYLFSDEQSVCVCVFRELLT